jgi:TetR/AcrR family transcriptional regulator
VKTTTTTILTTPTSEPRGKWHRARRPEQKQARRDAILASTRKLVDSVGINKTTLSAIAREANLSKAHCYRYFENREAILLQLVLEDTKEWSDAIINDLASLKGSSNLEAVSKILVNTTLNRPRLCELASSLWTVLEQNVSEDVLADFKRDFRLSTKRWLAALAHAIPELSEDQAGTFARFFLLFIGSAWPASKPSAAMKKVMKRSEFRSMKIDLKEMAFDHTLILLKGLLAP